MPYASLSQVYKNLPEGELQKMAYMFVRHSVRDYEAWKSVFDEVSDLRKRNGEKSYQILRQDNGSKELVALFEWDSLDNARSDGASGRCGKTGNLVPGGSCSGIDPEAIPLASSMQTPCGAPRKGS
jgi:hypothetical protein